MFKFSCCSFSKKENEEIISSPVPSISNKNTMSTVSMKTNDSTKSVRSQKHPNAVTETHVCIISTPVKSIGTNGGITPELNGFQIKQSTENSRVNQEKIPSGSTSKFSLNKPESRQELNGGITRSSSELNDKIKRKKTVSCFNFSYENDEDYDDSSWTNSNTLTIKTIKGNYLKDTDTKVVTMEQCTHNDVNGLTKGIRIGDAFCVTYKNDDFIISPMINKSSNWYIKIDTSLSLQPSSRLVLQLNKQEVELTYNTDKLVIRWNKDTQYNYQNITENFILNIGKNPTNDIVNTKGIEWAIAADSSKTLTINNKNKKHNLYYKIIKDYTVKYNMKVYLKINSDILELQSQ